MIERDRGIQIRKVLLFSFIQANSVAGLQQTEKRKKEIDGKICGYSSFNLKFLKNVSKFSASFARRPDLDCTNKLFHQYAYQTSNRDSMFLFPYHLVMLKDNALVILHTSKYIKNRAFLRKFNEFLSGNRK